MYVLKSARLKDVEELVPAPEGAIGGGSEGVVPEELPTVIYLDTRAFTRDCVGGWLRSSLGGFRVLALQDADQIERSAVASGKIQALIINTGPERMSSATLASLMSRLKELFTGVPVAVLSDYEDAENVREAFNLGAQAYIPTSLASRRGGRGCAPGLRRRHICARGNVALPKRLPSGVAAAAADRRFHPSPVADPGLPATRHGQQADRVRAGHVREHGQSAHPQYHEEAQRDQPHAGRLSHSWLLRGSAPARLMSFASCWRVPVRRRSPAGAAPFRADRWHSVRA